MMSACAGYKHHGASLTHILPRTATADMTILMSGEGAEHRCWQEYGWSGVSRDRIIIFNVT